MKYKKIIFLTIIVGVIVLLLSCSWDSSYGKDSGINWSGNDSIIIKNEAQLRELALLINEGLNDFNGKTVTLADNIDLKGNEWKSIGNRLQFQGVFDGNGKIIKGLTMPLFVKIGKNVIIKNLGGNISVEENYGTIEKCYSNGRSLVERNYGTIKNCYNTGSSLVGSNYHGNEGTIENSYYNNETSNQNDTGKGEPRTTTQMKQQITFINWNFNTIWGINSNINDGFSYLRNVGIGR